MRAIEKWIDKFCYGHPRFGIHNLMFYIALGNVAVYLVDTFATGGLSLSALLAFSRSAILRGEIWRLVTFVFLPLSGDILFFRGSGILFVVMSAYFYYWVGAVLEREWGTGRFTFFYLSGVVLNILFGLVTGGTSMHYVNLSLFLSFAVLFPDMQVLLFFLLPVKIKWIAWVDAALFALEVAASLLIGDVLGALLPIVAIFNFIVFFWTPLTESLGYRKQRFQHQHSKQAVNFKKATAKAYEEKGYIHKCAVCGKTDTEFPDLQFRYCSKCNGYYCYCEEHIHNHEHIQ